MHIFYNISNHGDKMVEMSLMACKKPKMLSCKRNFRSSYSYEM